jgi:RHS repeat-associated protein
MRSRSIPIRLFSNIMCQYTLGIILMLLLWLAAVQAQTSNTDGSTPLGLAPGAPAGSQALSDFDNVNPFNGNLNFHLPLLQVGGRGTASYKLALAIERKWRIERVAGTQGLYSYFPALNWWGGIMPGYSPGSLQGRRVGEGVVECPRPQGQTTPLYALSLTRLTFTAPDGTEFELRDKLTNGQPKSGWFHTNPCPTTDDGTSRGREFITVDGTSATFISDEDIYDAILIINGGGGENVFYPSGYLMLRDGTRYRIESGVVTWMRDRNGNRLSFTYGAVSTITDSLNRQILIEKLVQDSPPYGLCDRITYRGFDGANRIIRVSYANLSSSLRQGYSIQTLLQLFPQLNAASSTITYNPRIASSIWLPDGRSYRLYYNPYGELARVELPTGGAIEYDYDAGIDGLMMHNYITGQIAESFSGVTWAGESLAVYRRVVERRIYSNESTLEGKITYSRPESVNGQYQNLGYVEVDSRDPARTLLSRSRHYFYGSASASLSKGALDYPAWRDGREYQTESFGFDGTTLLQRVSMEWEQRAPVTWVGSGQDFAPPNDPRIKSTTTTWALTNQVSKKTFSYDQYNNQTEVYEYSFGTGTHGPLLRHTETFYLSTNIWQPGINYATDLNIHIRSLPTDIRVYDGSNTELSRTWFAYDAYPLEDCPNIVHHDGGFHTSYGPRGNLVAVTKLPNVKPGEETYVNAFYKYDIAGNVVKKIDGRGHETTFNYSDRFGSPSGEARSNLSPAELDKKISYGFPTEVTNALGHKTYTKYDYYLGKPVDSEDQNGSEDQDGVVTSFEYDDTLDRPTQIVRAANKTAVKNQTAFAYNDAARTITTTSDRNDFDDDNPLKSEVVYDGIGRTIESRQYETESDYIATNTVYDVLGRASKVSTPHRPGDPVVWTATQYDSLSRVTRVTTPDGAQVNTQYSGNQVTVTDQAGKKRQSETDAHGRLTKVIEDPGGLGYVTTYEYDGLNNLLKVIQGSQQRNFVYDCISRLTSATNPESGKITYFYDENSNLKTKTDARNITTTYEYDALNRLVTKTYAGGVSTPQVKYFYDEQELPNGKPTYDRGFAIGRLVAATYGGGSEGDYYGYDELGRVNAKYQRINTTNYQVQATYNRAGMITSETYPSGRIVNYSHDQAGRLTDFSGNLGDGVNRTYSTITQYHPAGMVEREGLGTQTPLYLKRRYNKRLQIGDVRLSTIDNATNSDRGALLFYYGPNAVDDADPFQDETTNNGNLWRQVHQVPKPTGDGDVQPQIDDYTYDALNRISAMTESQIDANGTLVQNVVRQNYGYDQFGNRRITSTAGGVNGYNPTYAQATNRIVGLGYDAAGNITSDVMIGGTMTYDAENRLLTATSGGSYTYNADGKRVKLTSVGQETWQVYGMGGKLLAEYNTNGSAVSPRKEYGYRNGQMLVVWDSNESGNQQLQWLVQDHLGSTRMVIDRSGSLTGITRHDFLPYGEELFAGVGIRNASFGYSSDSIRQKFTGKQRDTETGLDFFEARYFSSVQGRFTSPDEFNGGPDELYYFASKASDNPTFYADLATPQSLNKYQYTYNNPLKYTDVDGHCWPFCNELVGGVLKSAANSVLGIENAGRYYVTGQAPVEYYQPTTEVEAAVMDTTDKLLVISLLLGGKAPTNVATAQGKQAAVVAGSIRNVNPGFPTAPGRTTNCVNCAIATDATLAGRPASAMPGGPTPISVLEKMFGGTFQSVKSQGAIEKALLDAGNGARGIVYANVKGQSVGHVFNVVNQKGVIRFLDGQTGKTVDFRNLSNLQWLRTN